MMRKAATQNVGPKVSGCPGCTSMPEIAAPSSRASRSDSTRWGAVSKKNPVAMPREALFSTVNRPMKIGICRNSGRQDAAGLTPSSR